jgi:uncharacterized membrane protein
VNAPRDLGAPTAPVARVVPSWTEPAVAVASRLIGGPLGRHAVLGRSRFWTPLRAMLLGAVLVLAAGWLFRAPCIQQTSDADPRNPAGVTLDWNADRQYVAMCYSDIVTFYGGEHLDGGGLPYRTSWSSDAPSASSTHYLDYPVVSGFFIWETARLTRHYEALTEHARWLPTGLGEAVFFDLTVAALAACWLLVVWAVRRGPPTPPGGAPLVALSPLAFLHVFTGLDALAVAGATAGLYAFSRARPALAGVLLGLAAAATPYAALLLIPILLTASRRSRSFARKSGIFPGRFGDFPRASRGFSQGESGILPGRVGENPSSGAGRALGSAVLAWVLVNAPVAVLFTPGWLEYYRDGLRDAPGPDSIYNVLSYFTGWPRFAADQPPQALNWLVLGLIAAAVVGLAVLVRLAPVPPRLASLCFLLVAAILLVGKVWSPQFSLWLVPLAVLALPRWRLLMTWMAADALVWVPRMYYYLGVDHKGLPPDPFLTVVLIRDALVILVMVLVVRSILRPDTDPVRAIAAPPDADPDWPSAAVVPQLR